MTVKSNDNMWRHFARPMVVVFVAMALCASCQRDHLYYETLTRTNVQLHIDWSKTAFATSHKDYATTSRLNGVTVLAFDSATRLLKTELPPDADPVAPRLWLETGTYDLIVMNDSRVELPGIVFHTDRLLEDCRASVTADTVYGTYPDYLALSTIRNVTFETPRSAYYYNRPEDYIIDVVTRHIHTMQHAVTKKVNIKVRVTGINYCRGMQPSFMSGLSRAVNLATREPSREEAVYAFNLVNRSFRGGGYTEADLSQSFSCFGFNPDNLRSDTQFELTINFVLVDNSLFTFKADVRPQLEQWLDDNTATANLDLDINLDLEVDLPHTDPESTDIGGLVPETIPWNDEHQEIVL